MTDYDDYFEYLLRRKRAAVWYRNGWLYPRLSRHLKSRVLDVGCGVGDMVRFRPQTVGVDVNPRCVEHCRSQGLDVHLMQPDRLPFADHSFQGAVLDNVLEHLQQPQPLLAEIRRVLVSGGTFIVGVPGESGYASDSDHKCHYPEPALQASLKAAGFQPRTMLYQPFRSAWLDKHFRYYAIYGVFSRV